MGNKNSETLKDDVYKPKVDVYICIGKTDSNEWNQGSESIYIKLPKSKKVFVTNEIMEDKYLLIESNENLSFKKLRLFGKRLN